jgi:hypothetical protein
MKPILRALLVVTAAIATGASCGSSSSKTGESLGAAAGTVAPSTKSTPGSKPTPSSAQPNPAADARTVAETITQVGDLPAGWTLVEDTQLVGTNLNHAPDACDPDGLFSHHTAGRARSWSYMLNQDGTEAGHLSSLVKVAPTREVLTHQLARFASEEHHACEADRIQGDLTRARAVVTGPTTWSALPKTLPVPGGAVRYVTPYDFLGAKVMYTDIIWLGLGRTRIVIQPQACCTPPSDSLEDALIAAAATRLKAAANR